MAIIHASCVAVDTVAILITGASGAGKTSLALELMSRGAMLVSDDQTNVFTEKDALMASCPPQLNGLIEVYGVGVVCVPQHMLAPKSRVSFEVHLTDSPIDRLPVLPVSTYEGVEITRINFPARDASIAAKILFLAQVFQQTGAIDTVSVAKPLS